MSLLAALKRLFGRVFGLARPSSSGCLSRNHTIWLVEGLAAMLRRPAPTLNVGEQVAVADTLDQLRGVGYLVTHGTIDALHEARLSAAASKWLLFRPDGDLLVPVFVVKFEGASATVLEPGKPPQTIPVEELDQLATADIWRVLPEVARDETEFEKFGWRWIARGFLAHKPVIRDVVIASFTIAVLGLVFPLATQVIVDKVITNQAESTLITVGVAIGLMTVFSGLIGWLRQRLLLRLANVVDADLSRRVVHHLVSLPLPYFLRQPAGTVVNKITGIERIREFVASAFLLFVLDLPFMLIFLGMMFSYNVPLTGIVLGFITIMCLMSFVAGPILRRRAEASMYLGAKVQGFVTEQVSAVETVKALQLEPHTRRQFDSLNEQHLEATLSLREAANTYGTGMQTFEQLMNATVLCIGAWWAMTMGDFTIGILVAFQMFAQRVAQPLLKLSGLWQELQQTRVATRMVADVVNHPIERYSSHGSSVGAPKGALRIEQLSFAYSPELQPVYEGFTMDVAPGSVVLISGPSGSGKSTLAKLLLGLYTDYQGTIRLDGRDIRTMSVNELRAVFGVVPQESVLFTGTIIENLLAGAPAATFEQAVMACKLAGVHTEVENLPKGYQTSVGERGAGLSGGQRQRIAIARALLRKPRVLLFDEAVAGLDDKSAAQVAHTINRLAGRVTVLFISHKVPANLRVTQQVRIDSASHPGG